MRTNRGQNYIILTAMRRYMLPTVLSTVSLTLCQLIDAVMMGRILGETGLAAGCLVFPIVALINFFNGLLGGGGATQFSLLTARGNKNEAMQVFSACITGVFCCGMVLLAAGIAFMPAIASLLGAAGDTIAPTIAYGRAMLIGSPVILVSSAVQHFLRNDNAPQKAMISVLITNVINIIFDYVFMAEMGLGAAGAAYALILGSGVSIAYSFISHRTLSIKKPNLSLLGSAAKTGLGGSTSFVTAIIVQITCNTILTRLGGAAGPAMNSIVNNVNFLGMSIFMGVATATAPIVATFYGEKDYASLKTAVMLTFRLTFAVSVALALTQFTAARPIALLFGLNSGALEGAVLALRIMSLSSLTLGAGLVIMFYYQSTEKPGISSVLALMRVFLFLLPLVVLLSRFMGIDGVWWGRAIADILTLLSALIIGSLKAGSDQLKVLLIPRAGEKEEFREMMVNDMENLPALHQRVMAYCQKGSFDQRTQLAVCLVIEEMTANICAHGFQPGSVHYIDIRVGFDGEDVVVRIRDDGVLFNPLDYIERAENPEEQRLGIMLLRKISKALKYERIMSFNNLIIRI